MLIDEPLNMLLEKFASKRYTDSKEFTPINKIREQLNLSAQPDTQIRKSFPSNYYKFRAMVRIKANYQSYRTQR